MGMGLKIECKYCNKERSIYFGSGFLTDYKVLYNSKTDQIKNIGINRLEKDKNYFEYQRLLSKGWIEIKDFDQLKLYLDKIKCDKCNKNGYIMAIIAFIDWD